MKKKPLKVQPAKRIYQPKYPSYADKNPLLYPETRPYPFTQRFINWASTGGIASMMLFSGQSVFAQANQDTLYNPFPLEHAGVPYAPSSFGTGMPERLRSEEALKVIHQAFKESGIELKENVWYEDGEISVYLQGYSEEDEIGFLLIDYYNMDTSFHINYHNNRPLQEYQALSLVEKFKNDMNRLITDRGNAFQKFLDDKEKYINRSTKYLSENSKEKYLEKIQVLEANENSKTAFEDLYFELEMIRIRDSFNKEEGFDADVSRYHDTRFEDNQLKCYLTRYRHRFTKPNEYNKPIREKAIEVFENLKSIQSDEEFIEKFLTLSTFRLYSSGQGILNKNPSYIALKLEIMNSYPIEKWFDHIHILDEFKNKVYISLEETRLIDQNNKKGTKFIAPISMKDKQMIIQPQYHFPTPELDQQESHLRKERDTKNGMTDAVKKARNNEFQELSKQYDYYKIKKLPRAEQDSINNLKTIARQIIRDKYEAMELLTDAEKADYEEKFKAIREQKNKFRKAEAEKAKLKTLRALEAEVKFYIKWAKSQMGG